MEIFDDTTGAARFTDIVLVREAFDGTNQIQYYYSSAFGHILVINNEIQHIECWTPIYHEAVVHVPLMFLRNAKSTLILGGGSLFAARELLKYKTLQLITLVDWNPNVIQLSCEIYPELKAVRDDPRLQIIHQDAWDYLHISNQKFDFILNDAFNLCSISEDKYPNAYNILYDKLTETGIISDLFYRNIHDEKLTKNAISKLRTFKHKAFSLLAVPEYPGVLHLLSFWGKNRQISQNARSTFNLESNIIMSRGEFLIFNPKFLRFYLYIPPYLRHYAINC